MQKHLEELLGKVLALSYLEHSGQIDKGDQPYFLHLARVSVFFDPSTHFEEVILALLHDIIEDRFYSPDDLRKHQGVPLPILDALKLLTREDEDYFDYIEKIKSSTLAIHVKLADLLDNMDLSRLPNPDVRDYRRKAKYAKAFEILASCLDPADPIRIKAEELFMERDLDPFV